MKIVHDPLKEAIDIALEARAISAILSDALERLAESGAHAPGELHRLAQIANACSRLLNDVASEIEDASTELEALRRHDEGNPPQ